MSAARDAWPVDGVLPHGHPMLLVDRIDELVPGASIEAVKAVSRSEACFAGLDGATPASGWAYPRSLLVESFGQAAALLWWYSLGEAAAPFAGGAALPMLAVVRRCRFSGTARPGDVLRHHVTLDHAAPGSAMVSGRTAVGACTIAQFGELVAVAGVPADAGATLPIPRS